MDRDLREDAMKMIRAALAAADPYRLVRDKVWLSDGALNIVHLGLNLSFFENIYVIGAGKAGAPMARAVEDALGELVTGGLVVVKDGYRTAETSRVRIVEASHPVPDERAPAAAREILEIAGAAGRHDLVICLVSGGGSALLTLPAEGLSLEDIRQTTLLLLKSGAAIGEVNAVRKHLTLASGGRLAAAASPAMVVNLIISDVIGDDLGVIASGPTFWDESTYGEALSVLEGRGLMESVPETVARHLRAGAEGSREETPRRRNPVFRNENYYVLCSNDTAVKAAADAAATLGYEVLEMDPLAGEARERASELAALAGDRSVGGARFRPPACVIAGGETTVTVTGGGTGGRAQEFALAAAIGIEGLPSTLVFAFGTDGTDGPTGAAGAFADGATVERGRELGLDPRAYLADNDANRFFGKLDDLIMTGPTGTNVNDIYCALMG